MDVNGFSEGSRIRFRTAGRYPVDMTGTIKEFNYGRPEKGFADVETDEDPPRVVRVRPASMKAY